MPLDTTIAAGQSGHINDHEAVHQIANGLGFNPMTEEFGAVGNGVADDTTALLACFAAANAVSGTIYLPPGTFRFNGNLLLGTNTKLKGAGLYSTTLLANNSTACLEVGSGSTRTYTNVEHILFDGNNVSPMMLNMGRAFSSTFTMLRIINTAAGGEAVRADGTQNCLFNKLSITDFAGDGLRIYEKTAGDMYLGIRIASATSASSRHLVMDTDVGGGVPQNHFFVGGHIEGPHASQTVQIQLGDCANMFFNKVQINGSGSNTGPLRLVNVDNTAKRIRFNDCTLQGGSGTSGTTAIYLNDTLTTSPQTFQSGFTGRMRLQDLAAVVRLGSGNQDWEYMGPLVNGATDNLVAVVANGDPDDFTNKQMGPLVLESHTAGADIFRGKDSTGTTVITIDETGVISGTIGELPTEVLASDFTVTNNASLADAITVTGLVNGAKYIVNAEVYYTMGTTTSKAAIGWNLPGGSSSTLQWTPGSLASTVTSGSSGSISRDYRNTVGTAPMGGGAATSLVAQPRGLLTCGSNGEISLRFAQNTAESGISAVLKAGSSLTVRRIS